MPLSYIALQLTKLNYSKTMKKSELPVKTQSELEKRFYLSHKTKTEPRFETKANTTKDWDRNGHKRTVKSL